jgi:hypothetical protein
VGIVRVDRWTGGDLLGFSVLGNFSSLKNGGPKSEGPNASRIPKGLPVSGFPDGLFGKGCLFREEFPQRVFATILMKLV